MRHIATAVLLFTLLAAPALLTVAGLWMGLAALQWPTALALIGLVDFAPRQCRSLAAVAWICRPLAAAGVVVALLR